MDVFIKLSKQLGDRYKIVLVGTDDRIDSILPDGIISIHRTLNQYELAEIYSAADVFVNPTREEMFGMVNIESLACGTPVITFRTGGCPECLDESSGMIVDKDNIEGMIFSIRAICEGSAISSAKCLDRARNFSELDKLNEYIQLYERIS